MRDRSRSGFGVKGMAPPHVHVTRARRPQAMSSPAHTLDAHRLLASLLFPHLLSFTDITIKYFDKGSDTLKVVAQIFFWLCFVASVGMLIWFLFQMFVGSCGYVPMYKQQPQACM